MKTPLSISHILTLTGDSLENPSEDNNLVILYFDQNYDLIISISTDYTESLQIFFLGEEAGRLSQMLPFVKITELYTSTNLEHVRCVVPEGSNFFEEDFTDFNKYLGISQTKDFKFSM